MDSKVERLIAIAAGVAILIFGMLLVWRNQPISDANLVIISRILFAICAAVIGATVPGFIDLSWKGVGLSIRAGGALALFVLVYLANPPVILSGPAWLDPNSDGFEEPDDWIAPDESILASFERCEPVEAMQGPDVLAGTPPSRSDSQLYCSRFEFRQQCLETGETFPADAPWWPFDERVIRYDHVTDSFSFYRVSSEQNGSTRRTFIDRRDTRFRHLQGLLGECIDNANRTGAFVVGSEMAPSAFYHSGYQTQIPVNCFCDASTLNEDEIGTPIRRMN